MVNSTGGLTHIMIYNIFSVLLTRQERLILKFSFSKAVKGSDSKTRLQKV